MGFSIGDIIRGERFPADDGRGVRAHYAIIIGFDRNGHATAIIGTSVKTDDSLVSTRDYLVLSRRACRSNASWAATGLVRPTVFDRYGARIGLSARVIRQCNVSIVGEAKGKLLAWARGVAR